MTEAEIKALRAHVKELRGRVHEYRVQERKAQDSAALLDGEVISLELLVDRLEKGQVQ